MYKLIESVNFEKTAHIRYHKHALVCLLLFGAADESNCEAVALILLDNHYGLQIGKGSIKVFPQTGRAGLP